MVLDSQGGQQWERNIYAWLSPLARGLTGLAGVTTRPAGYPSGGVPPAVERQLHLLVLPSGGRYSDDE
jgi:hypothetical protein